MIAASSSSTGLAKSSIILVVIIWHCLLTVGFIVLSILIIYILKTWSRNNVGTVQDSKVSLSDADSSPVSDPNARTASKPLITGGKGIVTVNPDGTILRERKADSDSVINREGVLLDYSGPYYHNDQRSAHTHPHSGSHGKSSKRKSSKKGKRSKRYKEEGKAIGPEPQVDNVEWMKHPLRYSTPSMSEA